MQSTNQSRSITPPTQTLLLRPGGSAAVVFTVFFMLVAIFVVIASVMLSPFLLFILLPIIPGLIFVPLYRKKGFVNFTTSGIDLSGFRGKIAKHINYADIAHVVLAKNLTLSVQVGQVGYAVVFLDKNGDQLFFVWDYQYSKESLNALFALFEPKDTTTYDDVVWLKDLKQDYLRI